MSFPTYRQDFEGGTTLATACPELVDFGSAYAIDSTGLHALTGTHSLKATTFVTSQNIFNNASDTLAGDVTLSMYIQNGTNNASLSIYARLQPPGLITTNTYLRLGFASAGIQILQNLAGTVSTLNTPISGALLPTGVWLCLELRCNGATISARVVRQDTGQFFVNTGSGSWSSSPQVQSGTALVTGAGGIGFRGGDNTSLYLDDWIIEPAVPVIDIASFPLTSAGATQQLSAGGFTDPLRGVTWSSSNTGVATVNSAGLVTAVAGGSATITATGKRDTGQTATSTATVATTPATGYSFLAPSPPSGYANNASGSFVVTPDGTYTGSITITPSTGFGLSPFSHSWTASSTPWVFSILPTASGLINLAPTNSDSLTNASTLTYGALAQTLSVGPLELTVSLPAIVSFIGLGTRWRSVAPTFALSGPGSAGSSVGPVTVQSDTSATATVSPGTATGPIVFTDSTTGATTTGSVSAPVKATTWTYLASVIGFSSGLVGTVGYTIQHDDGSPMTERTTEGVYAIGNAGYGVKAEVPFTGSHTVLWDDGSGHEAFEVVPMSGAIGGPTVLDAIPVTSGDPSNLTFPQFLVSVLTGISQRFS